jgi:hypothetical protein
MDNSREKESIFLGKVPIKPHYPANSFFTFHRLLRESQGMEPIEFNRYIKVMVAIMGSIIKALIDHPVEYIAPSRGGKYFIEAIKVKRVRKSFNWKKHREEGVLERYKFPITRFHSYRMRWKKYRRDRFAGNMKFYKFRPTVTVKDHNVTMVDLFKKILELQNDPYQRDYERM